MALTRIAALAFLPQGESLAARAEALTTLPNRLTAAAGPATTEPLSAPVASVSPSAETSPGARPTPPVTPAPSSTDSLGSSPAGSAAVIDQAAAVASPAAATALDEVGIYIVFLDQLQAADPANTGRRVEAVLRSLGASGQAAEVFDYLNGFSIRLTATQANRLRSLAGVQSVEADCQVRLVDPVSAAPPAQDPITGMALRSYTDQQSNSAELTPWGAQAVWNGQYNASTAATLGTGKFAFVIDTGVSSTTADLNVDTQRGFNWINNSSNAEDDNGHGTHVAGTIGALVNNYGVVGVAPGTRIIPLKVLDANGSGSLSYSVSAVNYALQMINAPGSPVTSANAVVNLSLGAKTTTYKSLDSAIYNASKYGLRFAIAAGNSGSDVDGFTPARTGNDANVYTVSAVDNAYRMPSWSNWDKLAGSDKVDNIDFATPGVDVLSLSNRSGYLARMSGTSMASPHMAGLLLINNPANPFVRTDLATPYFSGTADPIAHL